MSEGAPVVGHPAEPRPSSDDGPKSDEIRMVDSNDLLGKAIIGSGAPEPGRQRRE